MDDVEREFMDALERLKSNQPTIPSLQKKAKLGILRINISTVAEEAGRSRTLIALERCRYPRVRAAVLAEMDPKVRSRTAEDVIRGLRQENASLRIKLQRADTVNAEMVLRMREIERTAKRKIRAAKREPVLGRNPNQVVGIPGTSPSNRVVVFPQAKKGK